MRGQAVPCRSGRGLLKSKDMVKRRKGVLAIGSSRAVLAQHQCCSAW